MKVVHMIFWTLAMLACTVFLTTAGKHLSWPFACSGYLCLFLGYLITEPGAKSSRESAPQSRPVTIEDWILGNSSSDVTFDLPMSPGKSEVIACRLCCKHEGNRVYSSITVGANVEDALQKAVLQIEETVGTKWRAKRGLLPVSVEPKVGV